MNMVDENQHGQAEIDRLQAEIENLVPYVPESLSEDNIEVKYEAIFCCVDGKTINAQLRNRWQARCPFYGAVPDDLKAGGDRPTDPAKLQHLQVAPLHVLLRSGEGFFKGICILGLPSNY